MEIRSLYSQYLKKNGLRDSAQRRKVFEVFLSLGSHVSLDDIYREAKKRHPEIGYATIYRTLKILCDAGICSEVVFEDGSVRYEVSAKKGHHDHLVCIECGLVKEFYNNEIEALQNNIAKKYGFELKDHKLILYGLCSRCSKKSQKKE